MNIIVSWFLLGLSAPLLMSGCLGAGAGDPAVNTPEKNEPQSNPPQTSPPPPSSSPIPPPFSGKLPDLGEVSVQQGFKTLSDDQWEKLITQSGFSEAVQPPLRAYKKSLEQERALFVEVFGEDGVETVDQDGKQVLQIPPAKKEAVLVEIEALLGTQIETLRQELVGILNRFSQVYEQESPTQKGGVRTQVRAWGMGVGLGLDCFLSNPALEEKSYQACLEEPLELTPPPGADLTLLQQQVKTHAQWIFAQLQEENKNLHSKPRESMPARSGSDVLLFYHTNNMFDTLHHIPDLPVGYWSSNGVVSQDFRSVDKGGFKRISLAAVLFSIGIASGIQSHLSQYEYKKEIPWLKLAGSTDCPRRFHDLGELMEQLRLALILNTANHYPGSLKDLLGSSTHSLESIRKNLSSESEKILDLPKFKAHVEAEEKQAHIFNPSSSSHFNEALRSRLAFQGDGRLRQLAALKKKSPTEAASLLFGGPAFQKYLAAKTRLEKSLGAK